ncbi:sugar MFS transporter [Francisella sp. 19X1-34]|uniref:sugar MFS transporter n=1 Tax=Francisella sp. 19X1-34 TaxID=3087177 RepID=UPI002E37EDF6|nr:sugar MFS transporter [Francisella sp. 19X1-34]MED7788726.1 sugar MFS transporter [Francisella sp. 19X1-34]
MKRNYLIVWVVMLGFFAVSFVTNILGPIIPDATKDLHLTLAQAGVLPFAFFIAYIISIPAGYMLERYGSKKMILFAFLLGSLGSILFCLKVSYITYIVSLFTVGTAAAILQVAFWPLLRVTGGEENYSFFSVLQQVFFGAASFVSPFVLSYLVINLPYSGDSNYILIFFNKLIATNFSWVAIYWFNAIVMFLLVIFISLIKFPKVELNADEKLEGFATIKKLLKNKVVLIYFFAIFSYVGQEQGISVWISKFLNEYHGFNTETVGNTTVALFWIMQCVGGILGIILLKLYNVKNILKVFLTLQLISLSLALFGSADISLIFFPVCGFLTSIMYGGLFSLGMNSLKSHHGTISGIFCTGIIGGAIVPLIVGNIGDLSGLRVGMCFVYFTIIFMLYVAIIANPLVDNKTIKLKELLSRK